MANQTKKKVNWAKVLLVVGVTVIVSLIVYGIFVIPESNLQFSAKWNIPYNDPRAIEPDQIYGFAEGENISIRYFVRSGWLYTGKNLTLIAFEFQRALDIYGEQYLATFNDSVLVDLGNMYPNEERWGAVTIPTYHLEAGAYEVYLAIEGHQERMKFFIYEWSSSSV